MRKIFNRPLGFWIKELTQNFLGFLGVVVILVGIALTLVLCYWITMTIISIFGGLL